MLTFEMLDVLCCPSCGAGNLDAEIEASEENRISEGALVCHGCGERFPVREGIPDLMPRALMESEEWEKWQRHLDGFLARREARNRSPQGVMGTVAEKGDKTFRAFSGFAGITEGAVLDVGCGSGRVRQHFDAEHVQYFGLDPIPTPQSAQFYFVRGLAEHIPFKDDTFSHIMVMSALDHFLYTRNFFQEVRRVLRPDGRLHILQTLHGIDGLFSAIKAVAQSLKDAVDTRLTHAPGAVAPKHMAEFSKSDLFELTRDQFQIASLREFSTKWYTPNKLLVTLSPRNEIDIALTRERSAALESARPGA